MEFALPQPLTLKRMLQALEIRPVREHPSYGDLPLKSVSFPETKITLPLTGEDLELEPQGNLLHIRIGKQLEGPSLICELPEPWSLIGNKLKLWLECELGRMLEVSERYCRHLSEHYTQGTGHFSFLQELKQLLQCDLFLINKKYNVVAWEGGQVLPYNPIPFVLPKLSSFKSLDLSPETPLLRGQWQQEPFPLSWYPIAGHQGVVGYLGLAVRPEDITQTARLFLYKTATFLFFELSKEQSIEDTERQHYRDFLFDLLYNNFDSFEVMLSRAKLWGFDLTKPHLVVVGEIPGFDPDGLDRLVYQELLDMVGQALSGQPRTIFLERNDQIVILFPLEGMLPLNEWNAAAKRLLSPILAMTSQWSHEVVFGMGNLYSSTRFVHRSFQEAKFALELGQLFNLREHIISFQDLGVMRLLLKLDPQELEDFRNEVLGNMLKFDQENNLRLEETLLAYFSSNGDLTVAGEKLFLHPNTLRYRLKKAGEILERDLGNLENQINLYIALKIGQLKSLWPDKN